MRCIVTAGPAWEPIDRVRRITNFSTGALGLLLSEALAAAGHEVKCLKGEAATAPGNPVGVEIVPFATNDDLQALLEAEAGRVEAVFHAAALCDYRVKAVRNDDGEVMAGAKIPSRAGSLTIELEPAVKVLPQMRGWFPQARLVGWKYELDGTGDDALEKANRQLAECGTDACVLNGAAWGAGFGFLEPGHAARPLATREDLTAFLVRWLAEGSSLRT